MVYMFICNLCNHTNVLKSKNDAIEYAYKHLLKSHNIFIDLLTFPKMVKRKRSFTTKYFTILYFKTLNPNDPYKPIDLDTFLIYYPNHPISKYYRHLLNTNFRDLLK